jgi:hypothetical protein
MGKALLAGAACAVLATLAGTSSAATLKADYRMLGSRASSVAGAPDLVDIGPDANVFGSEKVGKKPADVLDFGVNDGVSAATAGILPQDAYSVAVYFRFDLVNGYRRIVDFQGGTADSGLYDLNSAVDFYPVAAGGTTLTAGAYHQVVFTRDSTGLATAYLDGTQVFQFTDSSNLALLNDDLLRFFRDNESGGATGEASSGAVERIRLYSGALSASDVSALTNALPKAKVKGPSTAARGANITIKGSNFGPGESVSVSIKDSVGTTASLGSTTTSVPGAFTLNTTLPVPAVLAPGLATITATGATSGIVKTAKITLT